MKFFILIIFGGHGRSDNSNYKFISIANRRMYRIGTEIHVSDAKNK
jgi:hypothetical protein